VPRHRNELVRALGFDPDVKRSAMIPLGSRNGKVEWAWPQAVVDALVSGTAPGRAWQGEYISNRDAAEFATNIVGSGGFLSGMKPVKGALGMNMGARRTATNAGHKNPPVSQYDLPTGTDPRYTGAAPDRSDFTFLRYTPKKNTPRVEASLAALRDPKNPVRKKMMEDIKRGVELKGDDWYNTEELRNWFIRELGEELGHFEWAEYMDLMGAASPGSKVPANIGNAAAMRQRLYNDPQYRQSLGDIKNIEEARVLGHGRKEGYGHITQGLQELIASRQAQGNWSGLPETGVAPAKGTWVDQPKPKGFSQSLKGNPRNIAADLHFTRYMAMASRNPEWLSGQAALSQKVLTDLRAVAGKKIEPYIRVKTVKGVTITTFNAKKAAKDGVITADKMSDLNSPQLWADKPNDAEYAAFESLMSEMGTEAGLTGGQAQAALWMGAADRTGVAPSSQATFMELLRRRADSRAAKEGTTRADVLRSFIKDKGLLMGGNPLAAPLLMPSKTDPLSDPQRAAEFLRSGGV
jgi:hypothetical protein